MPIYGPSLIGDDKIWKSSMSGEGSSNRGEYLHSYSDTAASGGTETTMYGWYRLKCPVGYSSAGIGRFWEITVYGNGAHAAYGVTKKYYMTESNNSNQPSSGLNYTKVDLVYGRTTGASSSYGGSITATFFYKTGLSGYNNGEIHMRLQTAFREPAITCHFVSMGCVRQGTSYGAGVNSDVEFIGAHEASSTHDPGSHTGINVVDVGGDTTS